MDTIVNSLLDNVYNLSRVYRQNKLITSNNCNQNNNDNHDELDDLRVTETFQNTDRKDRFGQIQVIIKPLIAIRFKNFVLPKVRV